MASTAFNKKKAAYVAQILIFFMAFTGMFAASVMGETLTFTGKVVLTDGDARTVAIAPFDRGLTDSIFVLNEKVSVRMDSQKLGFGDIIVGDVVNVAYHRETDGINVIDAIAITPRVSERQAAYVILRNPWKPRMPFDR